MELFSGFPIQKCDLRPGEKCILFGAGGLGEKTASILQKNGFSPVCFVDNKKQGKCAGLDIFSPNRVPEPWLKLPVLVTVFNPGPWASFPVIEMDLLRMGFRKIIFFEHFYQTFPDLFGCDFYWLTRKNFYDSHQQEIGDACRLLADDPSRHLFTAEMHFRLGGPWQELPPASSAAVQYFDPGLFAEKHFGTFVDIGAFTGDTLEVSRKQGIGIDEVLALEPDSRNFEQLCQYLQQHRSDFPRALAIPAAAGRCNERLFFCENGSLSSSVRRDGGVSIPVVALDRICPNLKPDFIKMDIEGAEMEALSGMEQIIIREQPILAVSAYHRPEDLFRIPLYLKKLNPEYRFYLRSYGEHGFDTVLYAVPQPKNGKNG